MMNNEDKDTSLTKLKSHSANIELEMRENLTAIHVAAQLMCRQSEGRQTYPIAKNIVSLTEQALDKLKQFKQDDE